MVWIVGEIRSLDDPDIGGVNTHYVAIGLIFVVWLASDARFPGVEISTEWPDRAVSDLRPDARTAIVTLTHDPKLDDPALEVALRSEAFYIGSLGSKKTHRARLARLRNGFNDAALRRIQGPVGLSIGAKSPGEIAVSILAQVIERLRASL